MSNIEPFGYFRADACGWTDCHDDDEGAQPLWDNAAMCAIEKQRDELLEAAIKVNALSIQTDAHKELRAAIAIAKGGA